MFQFQGVPWLREHLGSLLRSYVASLEVRIDRGAAGGLPSLPSPARLVETFREGGLVALIQTREQRAVMARLQSAMAVIEGYSEHVMDALGERLIPDLPVLREAMDRRRHARSAPERVVERLFGLDQKIQQYERGKAFSDAVVAQGGIEALNLRLVRARGAARRARAAPPGDLAGAAWLRRRRSGPASTAAG